jgi:hypothetical protein
MKSIFNYLNELYNQDLSSENLNIVFNHHENRKLAELGDGVLDLVLKEHEYSKLGSTQATMDKVRQDNANRDKMKEILNGYSQFSQHLKEKGCTSPIGNFGKERCDASSKQPSQPSTSIKITKKPENSY